MKAEFYREYYSLEREHWWFLARKKILQEQIRILFPEKRTLNILNVGAAFGATTIMLQEFGEVVSVEYNKECCEYVKENLKMDFIHGSITSLPFQANAFDLVCAFDVVEHVQDDKTAISELHRVCKQGGYVFTTVPAFQFLWSDHDLINEHVRRYKLRKFLDLFDDSVANILYKTYFNFFLFIPVATFRILMSLVKSGNKKGKRRSDNSRVSKGFFSKILYRVFSSETYLLNKRMKLPFGISIMVISRRL